MVQKEISLTKYRVFLVGCTRVLTVYCNLMGFVKIFLYILYSDGALGDSGFGFSVLISHKDTKSREGFVSLCAFVSLCETKTP